MTELFILLKKPGENWILWANKRFTTEVEAIEYLKANIAYPVSDIEIRVVQTVATYGMKFAIEKKGGI
jgi:hypothetical protein